MFGTSGFAGNPGTNGTELAGTGGALGRLGGLTFFKDFGNTADLDADFAKGLRTATFTASRGAANPATYIDADGVIQLTTTSNQGRFTKGYYDSSGFSSAKGLLIEGASTNIFVSGQIDANNAWNGVALEYSGTSRWNVQENGAGATTRTVSVDTANNIGARSASVEITNAGAAATDVKFRATNTVILSDSVPYTISFYVKADAAKTIPLVIFEAEDDFTSFLNTTFDTVANTWVRIEKTFTPTTNGASDPAAMEIRLGNLGLFTILFESLQIEQLAFASSFIPTTTAALTRNKETLKYYIAGNRTANEESFSIRASMEFTDSGVESNTRYWTDTDTKSRDATREFNNFSFRPNSSDSVDSNVFQFKDMVGEENVLHVLSGSIQHSNPYVVVYYDGVTIGGEEGVDDYTDPAWGTFFYIGSNNAANSHLYGVVGSIAFFNRSLNPDVHKTINTLLIGA